MSEGKKWWCKSHHREATALRYTRLDDVLRHACAPGLGGILLPCDAEELTDDEIAEVERKYREPKPEAYIKVGRLLVPNPDYQNNG